MKRLLTALALTLLLAGLCITGICTIHTQYEKMDSLLQQAVACYEKAEMDRAADLAVEIEGQWVKVEQYLSLFVNHGSVDEVGASIAQLEPLALTGDDAAYLAACKNARLQLLHIRENEEVNLLNIF